jgi:hypothetical protein
MFNRTSYNKQYNTLHKQKHKLEHAVYYQVNKEKIKSHHKLYRNTHQEQIKKTDKFYYKIHKKEINLKRKLRRERDLNFKLRHYLSSRIWWALKRNVKTTVTLNLIGCTISQLKQHLEKQFKPGMSWSNYGKWHIDHIRPCASFDLSKPDKQKQCFHYTNLQPLWAKDNLKKNKFFKV